MALLSERVGLLVSLPFMDQMPGTHSFGHLHNSLSFSWVLRTRRAGFKVLG